MTDHPDFLQLARDVGNSIAGLAEPAVGGSRWQTASFAGEPQHTTDIFTGNAGIVIFLADLFAATGETRYRDLAEGGAMWVESESRAELTSAERDPSLFFGIAGHGLALLRLFQATDRRRWLDAARIRARALHDAVFTSIDPLGGAAGAGIFLLQMHRVTGDASELEAAVRVGTYGLTSGEDDAAGRRWPLVRRPGGTHASFGFAHGAAGVGHLLGSLFAATGDARFRDATLAAARWIESGATSSDFGVAWPRWSDDSDPPRYQWCHGAPGIGLFAIRAYEALGDASLKTLATRCGEATHAAGDIRQNPSQCHGLAGNGELFIELARVLGEDAWLERAREFGTRALAYREEVDSRVRWLGDEPGNYSPDFMLGTAGLGHFFLRLARPGDLDMPLLAPVLSA